MSGFGNSISTVDAMSGKPPFNKPHDNVCNVATLYPQYFHFIVGGQCWHQQGRGSQGQERHHPAARQHRRGR